MASPQARSTPAGAPALLSAGIPRAIRDALVDPERTQFERDYRRAMNEAAGTLDLTGVVKVLDTYRQLAEITQRQGPVAHQRMLAAAERLERGEHVPTTPGDCHRASIAARLAR